MTKDNHYVILQYNKVIDLSKALVCLFCALLLVVFPALSYSFVHEDEDDNGKIATF